MRYFGNQLTPSHRGPIPRTVGKMGAKTRNSFQSKCNRISDISMKTRSRLGNGLEGILGRQIGSPNADVMKLWTLPPVDGEMGTARATAATSALLHLNGYLLLHECRSEMILNDFKSWRVHGCVHKAVEHKVNNEQGACIRFAHPIWG